MEIIEIMKERHSVRQYTDKKIEAEKRDILNNLAESINREAGIHIQIFYDEPNCFNSVISHFFLINNQITVDKLPDFC